MNGPKFLRSGCNPHKVGDERPAEYCQNYQLNLGTITVGESEFGLPKRDVRAN
jgi:hypothetical protein